MTMPLLSVSLLLTLATGFSTISSAALRAQVPGHRVVSTKDVSYGTVRRFQIRASLPEHYGRDKVEQVAKAIVTDLTRQQPVNAVSILFYGPNTSTSGVYDVALVEWAPNGRWEDAASVRAGDYASFRYDVTYNAPAPARTTRLRPSGRTGLLGTPLPEGATLLQRKPGNPAAGRDPTERYAISASAEDIAGFFSREMSAAGWAKDGSSTRYILAFRKGKLMIGVLINREGKTFMLMGS